jgi:branched-chain amino acid transport system ATP-binding protein
MTQTDPSANQSADQPATAAPAPTAGPAPAASAAQSNGDAPLLDLDEIHVFYGNIEALKGLSMNVNAGEIVTLIGSNGAGKSTTLRAISGTHKPRTGTIRLSGRPIHHLPAHEMVKLGIGHSPEGRRVFSRMSVFENLQMGAFSRGRDSIDDDVTRVFDLFPRLKERRSQKAGTMSGGEQQMLAIGRALMARPTILLLDEPSMGLSPILTEQIFGIITEINGQGTTVLLVEQNALMALNAAHRGYVIQTGKIILSDSAANLAANEQVRQAYLGEI